MKIVILGASSYVGARVFFDLKSKYEVVGTYSSTKLSDKFVHLDITNKEGVENLIVEEKPEYIIHVANNASNVWCDTHKEEAQLLNVTSTEYIVDAANKIGAKVIYISSVAAINPSNYYGETKRDSEEVIKNVKSGWIILQPSLIIGYSPNTANDRPFNRILKNIDAGTEVQYDNNWQFQPTWLGQISEIIDVLIDQNKINISVPIMTEDFTTRFTIAKDILDYFNIKVVPIEKDKVSKDTSHSGTLTDLGLPTYSYKEIVAKIVDEIKHKDKFVI